ncbi:MAG: MBL fold metallo-hydrolase [Desulfovibrionaceae bacterium]|nr:MBL fold metallo-hydrolase [Desulfovibrionaceae bacterium]
MRLVEFALGPLETNCFLLHDEQEAVIIDVGGDPSPMLTYLRKNKLALSRILLTHLHFDHVLGVAALQEATKAEAYCSPRDWGLLEGQNLSGYIPSVRLFRHSDLDEGKLQLLGEDCRVLATPGHSPGSLSYYVPSLQALFGGDVLFYNSIGRTDFEGGNSAVLSRSIREKFYTLPGDTKVYTGHGQTTSIQWEKSTNPFVQA